MMRLLQVVFLAAFLAALANSQIVVKPAGETGTSLVMRSMKMHTVVEGQLATTEMEAVFNNPVEHRVEVEFIYTLMPDMICNFFAYYYGEEQVIARIVEKARARKIYEHITTRMRDPALIELIGKRTFKAKIFPVVPGADLKVQMHFVQALKSNRDGYLLELPIKLAKGQTLDMVDVQVVVKPGSESLSLANNYGMTNSDPMKVEIKGEHTRPAKNLRVQISRSAKPLQVACYAAPSGGRDGFFALTLTPNRAMSSPRLTFAGSKVYAVSPLPKRIWANQSVLVTGRYRDAGNCNLTLTDHSGSLASAVAFGGQAIPNNAAAMLWGARQIEITKDRKVGIALSTRYNMPGRFTSWLAIPKEERERYKLEMARADLAGDAKELARIGAAKGFESIPYKSAFAKFKAKSDARGVSADDLVGEAMYQVAEEYGRILSREISAGRDESAAARRALAAINSLSAKKDFTWLRQQAFDTMLADLADEVVAARMKGASETEVRRRQTKYERLEKKAGLEKEDRLAYAYQAKQGELAVEAADLEIERKTDTPQYKAAVAGMRRIEKYAGESTAKILSRVKVQRAEDKVRELWMNLSQEIYTESYTSERMKRTKAELKDLEVRYGVKTSVDTSGAIESLLSEQARVFAELVKDGAPSNKQDNALGKLKRMANYVGAKWQPHLDTYIEWAERMAARDVNWAKAATIRDDKKIADAEGRLARLTSFSKHDRQTVLATGDINGYIGYTADRQAAVDELRKPKPDQSKVKIHLDRLEQSDLQYERPEWAKARRDRIVTEVEIDKLQHTQLTPEIKKRIASLKVKQSELRARMGDPLVTFDGPADCRRVVALLPDGTILPLAYNAATGRWEARFDIPPGTAVGDYAVQIVAVTAEGKRVIREFRYTVDYTAPKAQAKLDWINGRLRLRVTGDQDIWRVEGILPDGSRITLSRDGSGFVAWPDATLHRGDVIRFVVFDKAHNRTEMSARTP